MPEQKKNPNVILESEIPENWQPVEQEPIAPGQQPPPGLPSSQDTLPPYFRGSISPSLQHDSTFVKTGLNPRVPTMPLMPTAPSADPQFNAAVRSTVKTQITQNVVSSGGLKFRGVWASSISYNPNDIVIFDGGSYVALSASTGLEPDQNVGSWTLLSQNLQFPTNPTPPYLPYQVVEFRGSMFVCLSQTLSDPFTQPSAWALISQATGFAKVITS